MIASQLFRFVQCRLGIVPKREPQDSAYTPTEAYAPPSLSLKLRVLKKRFFTRKERDKADGADQGERLKFEVITNKKNLCVFYTPCYLINWSKRFGTLTTPAKGFILPGCYKFGAEDEFGRLYVDHANVDVPPEREAYVRGI